METTTKAAPAYDHDLVRVLCPQAYHEVNRLRQGLADLASAVDRHGLRRQIGVPYSAARALLMDGEASTAHG